MQTTLENKKKVIANSPISVLKRNNKVEEGGTLSLGMERE
jgi:hypothetical protein